MVSYDPTRTAFTDTDGRVADAHTAAPTLLTPDLARRGGGAEPVARGVAGGRGGEPETETRPDATGVRSAERKKTPNDARVTATALTHCGRQFSIKAATGRVPPLVAK